MAPQGIITFLPPLAPVLERLPDVFLPRLGSSMAVVAQEENPQWEPILREIKANHGFTDLQISQVNKVIFLIPTRQRVMLTETILAMVHESDVAANAFTYDLLMMAHAEVGNVEIVRKLYKSLKEGNSIGSMCMISDLLTSSRRGFKTNSPHLWTSP